MIDKSEFLEILLTIIKDTSKFILLMFVSELVISLICIIIRWIISILFPVFEFDMF